MPRMLKGCGCAFAAFALLVIGALAALSLFHRNTPLPPRPMFHILNTEEIRSFDGPDWHIGPVFRDTRGRDIYIDKHLNLVLIILFPPNEIPTSSNAPRCSSTFSTFYFDSEHEFTVTAQTDVVLTYHRGALVAQADLPKDGVQHFGEQWSKQCFNAKKETDAQLVLNAIGVDLTLPVIDSK